MARDIDCGCEAARIIFYRDGGNVVRNDIPNLGVCVRVCNRDLRQTEQDAGQESKTGGDYGAAPPASHRGYCHSISIPEV